MDNFLSRRPAGIEFNTLSETVFELLSNYTAFPWPLLRTQAERRGADPAELRPTTLKELIGPLATGVARFNTPEAGREVQRALERLL